MKRTGLAALAVPTSVLMAALWLAIACSSSSSFAGTDGVLDYWPALAGAVAGPRHLRPWHDGDSDRSGNRQPSIRTRRRAPHYPPAERRCRA